MCFKLDGKLPSEEATRLNYAGSAKAHRGQPATIDNRKLGEQEDYEPKQLRSFPNELLEENGRSWNNAGIND